MDKYPNIKTQHDVLVRTDRLLLRPVATEDLSALHRMRLNPIVMQFMPGVETEQEALNSYSLRRTELMMMQDRFSFAVVLPVAERASELEAHKDKTVTGFVGITQPTKVFYIFNDKYWGSGFASEALQCFLETYWKTFPSGLKGVDKRDRDHLEAHIYNGNDGSERVATKCGFVHVSDGFTSSHGREVRQKIFSLYRPLPS
ncbi:hypothetical protein VP1G_11040 [Cytospora mali]|uniref:N-acetyltransferase domain-containing protein n=1 Tax=Cytospora mali TaxID=578113 RepID=A0A194V354_CYTMA|nr:hypothetical protein VP1G_11040 [Valsa mali var. pyri (nom. inval.)]